MKTLKIFFALTALFIGQRSFAQFTTAELQVSGLTCSMCSKATEKALRTLPFISDIKPDLNKNLFMITFAKGQKVDLDQISKKVQGAGFSVNKLAATFQFSNLAVKDNFHFNYGGNLYHFMQVDQKTLNGPVKLTVLDRHFVPAKSYSNWLARSATYPCYKTGKMEDTRVYHVTI